MKKATIAALTTAILIAAIVIMVPERERPIDTSIPSNACIAETLEYVPLGTPLDQAKATLESLGLSCKYRKGNPTSDDKKSWRQNTLFTEVVETDSIFSKSRYVPTLYFENDVVTKVMATPRRSMTVSNKPDAGDG